MSPFSESRRQGVHVLMSLFALALRYLAWWQAALCAVGAFLFNLLVLPRLGGSSLYRPADRARGYPLGILLYPLSVLVLVLAFPRRPDIVAAAWGILAVGDGAATLVGRHVAGRRLPWNPEKTIAGSAALAVAGGAAGVLLAAWTRPAVSPEPPLAFVLLAPPLAAVAAAFVESLRVRLDDNISVPMTAAIVLGALGMMDAASAHAAVSWLPSSLLLALAVNVPVAFIGWRAGSVSTSGAAAGAVIGITVLACTGIAGWALLFASFLLATASTRLGMKRKAVLGIAEERGGRRGPGNAIANTGLAALAATVAALSPYREGALLVMVTALAAGASDTVASEVGKAWGRRDVPHPDPAARPTGNLGRRLAGGHGGGARLGPGVVRPRWRTGPDPGQRPVVRDDRRDDRRVRRERPGLHARAGGRPRQRHAELHQHGGRGGRGRGARMVLQVTPARDWLRTWLEFARPFTLFAPALGMASGGVAAIGARPPEPWAWHLVFYPLLGGVVAAVLNAASNGLNQIYDLDIDRVNKPRRPLPERPDVDPRGLGLHGRDVRGRLAARLGDRARRPTPVVLDGRGRQRSSPPSTRCPRSAPSASASGQTSPWRSPAGPC